MMLMFFFFFGVLSPSGIEEKISRLRHLCSTLHRNHSPILEYRCVFLIHMYDDIILISNCLYLTCYHVNWSCGHFTCWEGVMRHRVQALTATWIFFSQQIIMNSPRCVVWNIPLSNCDVKIQFDCWVWFQRYCFHQTKPSNQTPWSNLSWLTMKGVKA